MIHTRSLVVKLWPGTWVWMSRFVPVIAVTE